MVAGYGTEIIRRATTTFVRVTDLGTTASITVMVNTAEAKDQPIEAQRSAVATVTERDSEDVQLLGSFGDALMFAVADDDEEWTPNHERP